LGEQYSALKGKVTGQRILDSEGPSIETSVSVSGTMKGVQVEEMITAGDSLSFLHNLNNKTKLHNSLHTVSFLIVHVIVAFSFCSLE
jgi:hypothetical protein